MPRHLRPRHLFATPQPLEGLHRVRPAVCVKSDLLVSAADGPVGLALLLRSECVRVHAPGEQFRLEVLHHLFELLALGDRSELDDEQHRICCVFAPCVRLLSQSHEQQQ